MARRIGGVCFNFECVEIIPDSKKLVKFQMCICGQDVDKRAGSLKFEPTILGLSHESCCVHYASRQRGAAGETRTLTPEGTCS